MENILSIYIYLSIFFVNEHHFSYMLLTNLFYANLKLFSIVYSVPYFDSVTCTEEAFRFTEIQYKGVASVGAVDKMQPKCF